MTGRPTTEELLQRYVENHVVRGTRLSPEQLCGDRTDLVERLRGLIERYHQLDDTMSKKVEPTRKAEPQDDSPAPVIDGFQIIERIGRGGMGVVYRATDLLLRRDVALKILPEAFAGDAERMGRFQREAQALAEEARWAREAEPKQRLQAVLERSHVLATVHRSRQQLQQVWDRTASSQEALLTALQQWCREAEASGIKALEDFARSLRNYRPALP